MLGGFKVGGESGDGEFRVWDEAKERTVGGLRSVVTGVALVELNGSVVLY